MICGMPPATGNCNSPTVKYYFDANTRQCVAFQYGGCNGNPNRFDDESTCTIFCQAVPPQMAGCPSVTYIPLCYNRDECTSDAQCSASNIGAAKCCRSQCHNRQCYSEWLQFISITHIR